MAITTYEGLLETWADEIETMEQNLETLYGTPSVTPVLPAVTNEDGMLEAAAELTDSVCWDFAKMYNYLTAETGTTQTVTVPATAIGYGGMLKLGGKIVRNDGSLLFGNVSKIVSKDTNGNVIDTIDIPDEVQELTGYGWGAGAAYNYIDFANKKFVQQVGRVNLGSLTWTSDSTTYPYAFFYSNNITDKVAGSSNIVTARYDTATSRVTLTSDMLIAPYNAGNSRVIVIRDDGCADAAALIAVINGEYAYYEISTAIETDISAYLTDTEIKVVPGGTLTFVNANNLDVYSEVNYIS